MLNNQGYSLLEVLIVLLLGSLIMLSCTLFFVQLQTQTITLYQRFRLLQFADYLFDNIEKDLRRSGFSTQGYLSDNVKIMSATCVVIGYDFQRNGTITFFAYRWLDKTIQQKSGGLNCEGGNWESLNDLNEILVSDFVVKQFSHRVVQLTLQLSLSANPAMLYRETRYVTAFNH